MMNFIKNFTFLCLLTSSFLFGTELTVCSYNCGGLTDHYDYLRAISMGKLMQDRYRAEPEQMFLNEDIQKVALRILFARDDTEKALAQQEWELRGYQAMFRLLSASPHDLESPNRIWNEKAENMISSYKVRPVILSDEKVSQMLDEHLQDLSPNPEVAMTNRLNNARTLMATRILAHHLNYDLICLQEADYLDRSMFPENYHVVFSQSLHSINGIAWNKERLELLKPIGDILGRAYAAQFLDKQTRKTILVATGHLTGCNPFFVEFNPVTGESDSAKGDAELQTIVDLFESDESDLKVIAMDSNVTSLHPRLGILKKAHYQLDCQNHLEMTCTNPYQVLNTRIDWILFRSNCENASIKNIPVLGVGLNSLQTNMSDHKPVAARIDY